jgi:uncharacterized protein (UPF0248 family)
MIPIQDLLHRIQWDPEFGSAAFEIGYVDRVAGGTVRKVWRDGPPVTSGRLFRHIEAGRRSPWCSPLR